MDVSYEYEKFDALVVRIFNIEDITLGTTRQNFIARYRGHLLVEDSAAAYDRIAEELKPLGVMPLFRVEEGRQVIFLVPRLPEPRRSNPYINLVLFVITLLSVMAAGALYGLEELPPPGVVPALQVLISRGWPFAVSMIAILGAHEFGHYLAGRRHGVHVTLPYFIPLPLSPFGTMGAFINMKEPPKNKRHLLDIGIAGPLAGLVVAVPVLLIGLSLSDLGSLPLASSAEVSYSLEGNSLLYLFVKWISFGRLIPAPVDYGSISPVVYWLRYFFTGQPFPFGGVDVMLHPVAWAGWAGILVTSLNLIPAGQLDGGHMVYVLLGKERARKLWPLVMVFLMLMGVVWSGWWLWAGLIFLLGRTYAEPLDQITQLDPPRKTLAVLAFVVFLITFTPVPLAFF